MLGKVYGVKICKSSDYLDERRDRAHDFGAQAGLGGSGAVARPSVAKPTPEEKEAAREAKVKAKEAETEQKQQISTASKWMKRIITVTIQLKSLKLSATSKFNAKYKATLTSLADLETVNGIIAFYN